MSAAEDDRLARLTLSLVAEPGSHRVASLVARLGAVALLDQLRDPDGADDPDEARLATDFAQRLTRVEPERVLEQSANRGIRFIIPGDAEWPSRLDDLRRSPVLYERGGAPVGLWVRGEPLADVVDRSVSIVGSRSCTAYGEEAAFRLAADLAAAGHTIISGGAFGIDFAAHRGALAAAGRTVVVLASGVDRPYPAGHRGLFDHAAQEGAVVSETPPGAPPTRVRFLGRNRIIGALSRGTVVIEAALRSGALNTAQWAAGIDRVLMGLPGPVTSEPSAGVHQMIRVRHAVLVTAADEVLEAVSEAGHCTLDFKRAGKSVIDRLNVDERQVLDAVPVSAPVAAESIAHTAGLGVTMTREVLPRLHDLGLVSCHDGRWRLSPRGA